jgi:hypothetical protein
LLPERTNSVPEKRECSNAVSFEDAQCGEPTWRGNEFRTVWCERDDCPCALFDENFPDAPVIMLAGGAGKNQICENCVKKKQTANQNFNQEFNRQNLDTAFGQLPVGRPHTKDNNNNPSTGKLFGFNQELQNNPSSLSFNSGNFTNLAGPSTNFSQPPRDKFTEWVSKNGLSNSDFISNPNISKPLNCDASNPAPFTASN